MWLSMVDPKLEEGTKFRQAENYSPGPNLELMLKLWLVSWAGYDKGSLSEFWFYIWSGHG